MRIEIHSATVAEIFGAFVSTDAMLGRMQPDAVERALIRDGKTTLPLHAGETMPRSHYQMCELIHTRLGGNFDQNTISLFLEHLEDKHRKIPVDEVMAQAT